MDDAYILLVEDNPDDVSLTLRALRKGNIQTKVFIARDGVEALEYFFGNGNGNGHSNGNGNGHVNFRRPMPQLVILDLKLPKIDGLEVLARLRADERTQLLPIIVLTTSNERSDVVNCYRHGANSFIRKPVDFSTFNEVMKQVGRYWLELNEAVPKGSFAF